MSSQDTIDLLSRLKSAAFPGVASEELPEKFELPESIVGPLTFERIKQDVEREHLLPNNTFSAEWLNKSQQIIERDQDFNTLLTIEPSPAESTITLVPYNVHGVRAGYYEKSLRATHVVGSNTVMTTSIMTAKNSTSFSRAPGKRTDFVRGKAGYFPFTPGGLDQDEIRGASALEAERDALGIDDVDIARAVVEDLALESEGLLTKPPGFNRGMFSDEVDDEDDTEVGGDRNRFNIADILTDQGGDEEADFEVLMDPVSQPEATAEEATPASTQTPGVVPTPQAESQDEVDAILDSVVPVAPIKRSITTAQAKGREWAHVVDVNLPFDDFYNLVPEMAHPYPFELDTFQKRAVYHLEKSECVFVAAHTSAGKTVVAEYAIALAAKHMTKAIYTSPIKALSNQKYRDFKETFEDVGILTGDIQLNPEASCLIMTTEILRSMLYRGADLIRDVEFVIFDEVHYVNDLERGVVWEEVIIMLPAHVTLILLSATVPNTKEFADWVGRTKKRDIYVISTPKRPVPLEHHLFANREIYKIVDAKQTWQALGYKNAVDALSKKEEVKPAQRGGRGGSAGRGGGRGAIGGGGGGGWRNDKQDKNLFTHLVGYLHKKQFLPVVVFTFSKKKCEENATGLSSTDLMTSSDKSRVHIIIEESIRRLPESDRDLPQIERMRDLLGRGIAVHHSGLLPIMKELVEILFAKGLVRVLFATETFAMGVNMPARTVVFSGIRKHDGRSFRNLLPGEYTQMSGRAGRRGLDSTGLVIIATPGDPPEATELNSMILGKATKLESQFRLTYNMILNLLRVEALRVEEMIKRSFSENTSQKAMPERQRQLDENTRSIESLKKLECMICNRDIDEFYNTSVALLKVNVQMMGEVVKQSVGIKALGSGRVVVLNSVHHRNALAIVLKTVAEADLGPKQVKSYYCAILTEAKQDKSMIDMGAFLPITSLQTLNQQESTLVVEKVQYFDIFTISDKLLQVDVEAIIRKDPQASNKAKKELILFAEEIEERRGGIVNEYNWTKFKKLEFQQFLANKNALFKRILQCQCNKCPELKAHYAIVHKERELRTKLEELQRTISDQNLELLPDYHQRVAILKELNYLDFENSTVQLKGRVACEINSADELILTELILENKFSEFEPEEVVALLSCFVCQEKNASEPSLTPQLTKGRAMILEIEQKMAEVQQAHGLENATAPGNTALRFGLAEVVYEWARGMKFRQITELTDVQEGSIVRTIHRLDETCNEVKNAARMIGDAALYTKMDQASQAIKRDIVFAASLYYT
ncbi:NUC185 domain-containing protein [Mortierella sp. GBAus27b]|nr:NUC185 domain-containing protein [Mortierella sp. GBAus27b]